MPPNNKIFKRLSMKNVSLRAKTECTFSVNGLKTYFRGLNLGGNSENIRIGARRVFQPRYSFE